MFAALRAQQCTARRAFSAPSLLATTALVRNFSGLKRDDQNPTPPPAIRAATSAPAGLNMLALRNRVYALADARNWQEV